MKQNEIRGQLVANALAACPTLAHRSEVSDAVWFAVEEAICTKSLCLVVPLGSAGAVQVSPDHAMQELLAAMQWLISHEVEARSMPPRALYIKLRGVATRGADGSARAAQADELHGMTHVPPGSSVVFADVDPTQVAS